MYVNTTSSMYGTMGYVDDIPYHSLPNLTLCNMLNTLIFKASLRVAIRRIHYIYMSRQYIEIYWQYKLASWNNVLSSKKYPTCMVGAEIRSKFEGLLNTRGDEPNGGTSVLFSNVTNLVPK